MSARTYEVAIEPLEPLLFGDNRSARPGFDHLQLDEDPSPLTLHGAIGRLIWDALGPEPFPAALGDREEDILMPAGKPAELRGVATRDPEERLWFPKPLHFRCRRLAHSGALFAADTLRPSAGWRTSVACDQGLPMLLYAKVLDDETDEPLLVSAHLLRECLTATAPRAPLQQHVRIPDEVFRRETRPGLAIDNATGLAREGLFFSRPYRRFAPPDPVTDSGALGWGFQAWFDAHGPLDGVASRVGFLGGDRRRAKFTFSELPQPAKPLQPVLDAVLAALPGSAGPLLYFLTPKIAGDPFDGPFGKPVAAAIGRARYASGWNNLRGEPRPLVALEPAGSVYFFEWPATIDADGRRRLVEEAWLASFGAGGAAGFGRALVGVWR